MKLIKKSKNDLVLNSMTTYDILEMTLYNLWIHIAEASAERFLYPRPVNRLTTSAFGKSFLMVSSCPLLWQIKLNFCAIFYSTPVRFN
ncbi:hypothetical protein BpHYR1_054010 [Brachionus plicatilis]|uniref:Uncharacterized protein n=1 Tax=Brachionus plicatilis TaxID=10195 RepID=A0A3M7PVF7_BRAPC|nr:hypothetical protein BpHYR1_054010 [Brachionus plicatilis]